MAEQPEPKPSLSIGGQPVTVQLLDEKLRRIALTIGIMIIAGGAITALALVWPLIRMVALTLVPFAVGLVFAYIFDPIVTFVQRRLRLSRIGGVLFLYLLFLLAISVFFAIMLPILITQVKDAWTGISGFVSRQFQRSPELLSLWERAQIWMTEHGIVMEDLFRQAAGSEGVQKAAQNAASSSFRFVGDALAFFFSVVITAVGSVTFILLAVLVNIYLLLDFSKIRDVIEVMIPSRHQERTFVVLGKVDVAVGGFVRGMLIDAFLVGLLTFVGLYFLGLQQYALLIGILAAIGTLIPYMGPISGGGPALMYVIFSDAYDTTQERLYFGIGVLVLTVIIQTLEGFVFQPKIVGKAAQLHPLAVLFALAFGANFGLLGMILAVPVACIARVLAKEFFWDERESAWKLRTGKKSLGDWQTKEKEPATEG